MTRRKGVVGAMLGKCGRAGRSSYLGFRALIWPLVGYKASARNVGGDMVKNASLLFSKKYFLLINMYKFYILKVLSVIFEQSELIKSSFSLSSLPSQLQVNSIF